MPHRKKWRDILVPTTAVVAFVLAASAGGQPPASGTGAASQAPTAPATIHREDVAIRVTSASVEPADIAWGPGREVQAGLRVRLWAGSQHASRFIFDVYIRNRTDHMLNVTCPSFAGLSVPSDSDYSTEVQSRSIYCSPHLRDSQSKQVSVRFLPRTDEQQYAIAPGQSVYISHWLLRTMNRRVRGTNSTKYTQVAFVETGKHRMSCDVSVLWGGRGDRYRKLRTGEAAFDVTAADIEAE